MTLDEDYSNEIDMDDDDEEERFKKRKISRRNVDDPAPPSNAYETVVEVLQNNLSPKLRATCNTIQEEDCSCS